MSTSEGKKVTLKSSDGEIFEVDVAVAMQMQTIKHMIEDDCAADLIPVANVHGKTMSEIIEYCKNHVEGDEKAKAFDIQLAKRLQSDQVKLYDVMMGANYLDIKALLDLTCQAFADMIKGKTPEQIRRLLNIKNDFTPEEEAEIRRENQWAFE